MRRPAKLHFFPSFSSLTVEINGQKFRLSWFFIIENVRRFVVYFGGCMTKNTCDLQDEHDDQNNEFHPGFSFVVLSLPSDQETLISELARKFRVAVMVE